MRFGELEIGDVFYIGYDKYIRIADMVDYDNANRHFNSVVLRSTWLNAGYGGHFEENDMVSTNAS